MEWIAGALVLIFLLWRWPKWTAIAGGAGLVFAGLAVAAILYYESKGRAERQQQAAMVEKKADDVVVTAVVDELLCPGLKTPVYLRVANQGQRIVTFSNIGIDVFNVNFSNPRGHITHASDRILKPREAEERCYPLRAKDGGYLFTSAIFDGTGGEGKKPGLEEVRRTVQRMIYAGYDRSSIDAYVAKSDYSREDIEARLTAPDGPWTLFEVKNSSRHFYSFRVTIKDITFSE